MHALLVALWTTGCRVGELLSLQWGQIQRDDQGEARWLVLPGAKTKTAENRVIPIGTRLRAELSTQRHAPDGRAGGRLCLRRRDRRAPTDVDPPPAVGRRGAPRARSDAGPDLRKLTVESRAAYLTINLHIHNLRREFASQLLESGADLHDVQMFLGHANITTTSRYLQSTPVRLERALKKLERWRRFTRDSHMEASKAPASTSDATPQNCANSLN